MLKNYIKIAWRNLLKHRSFSIINIVGLSFSVAFCLLLFFYIRHEQSYDSFHAKKNRLFRLEMTDVWASPDSKKDKHLFSFLTTNDDVENSISFPLIVGTDLQSKFPEIKNINRFYDIANHWGKQLVKAGNQVFKEQHVIFTDDNFFKVFSFHLKTGNSEIALTSPGNVVISETIARKYFGNENAIGKTIEIITQNNQLFTIAGIAEDAPSNSSIQFDILLPNQSDLAYKKNIEERFNHASHVFIVELGNNVSPQQFESKLQPWVKTYFADYIKEFKNVKAENFHWYLRPFTACHYNKSGDWGHYTNANNIYQLACLVIVILLIASLNYVLLVISNAAARSQEVGVRKVMGANRRAIVLQFWVETQIMVLIAVLLGLLLTRLLLPLFNTIIGVDLNFNNFSWTDIFPTLVVLSIVLGVLAGYYPARIISKMKPVSILKSFATFKMNPRFSKVTVVLQYTSCVVLMIVAFIMNRQMQYISNKDLGFEKDQILIVSNPTYDDGFTKKTRTALFNFAASQRYIKMFSGMNAGLAGGGNTNGFELNGELKERKQLTVDYDYFEMLGLKLVQGRSFSRAIASDTSSLIKPVVVNETLYKMLGNTAAVGRFCEPIDGTIIGIVKDYHFETLSKKIEPQEHRLATKYEMNFLFKVKAGQMQTAIAKLEKEWKSITNNYPFEYTFLDQTISKMYEPEIRWQNTIQASCFFAILIACMGLFGLSAINAVNRTKEIGIRKILGASIKDIVRTLSSGFLVLVGISIIIASPIAWWIMNNWLQDFAYRTQISWWMIISVGLVALIIALITVSVQAIKAALANPVDSLRAE